MTTAPDTLSVQTRDHLGISRQLSTAPQLGITTELSALDQLHGLALVSSAVRQARAYCGPAHGRSWLVETDGAPAPTVDMEIDGEVVSYRLVHHPRTRRPVRDDFGSFLYMPTRRIALP